MNTSKRLSFVINSFKKIKIAEIRPYENYNFLKLMRMKGFFSVCKNKFLISNINSIYEAVSRIVGKRFINKFVQVMYGDLLTGGGNFNELEATIKCLEKDNIISIIDYCRESLTKDDENVNFDFK